jgi:hypothetical protein
MDVTTKSKSKSKVYRDYKPGDRFVVTRKNHHLNGRQGTVSGIHGNSVYGYLDSGELWYFAFNSVYPLPF